MPAKLGFLTVRLHEEHGYFGGYLVVNHQARPLEFHCTLPVKPSKAQVILYGSTIEDFVCGEQIGKTLVSRAKVAADLVITDTRAVLAMSLVSDTPILQVDVGMPNPIATKQSDSDSRAQATTILGLPFQSIVQATTLEAGNHRFFVPDGGKKHQSLLEKVLSELGENFDFAEPFTRIVEALIEAHPTTKAA